MYATNKSLDIDAAFLTFVTFVIFAGICLFLLPRLLQLLLLAVDLIINHDIAIKDILKRRHVLLVSLTQYHFLNHCIGSLSDVALFLRFAQLPITHFHLSSQHIYIHCVFLQDSLDSFDHLILIYFSFPVLRQMSVELTPC